CCPFTAPPTYPVSTLSLHDALPISFFDDALPGFGVRLRASGVQRYVVQYKIGGKHRRLVLGSPAEIDLGKAREKARDALAAVRLDRKSTRLNSSHEWISYAVFCLKK